MGVVDMAEGEGVMVVKECQCVVDVVIISLVVRIICLNCDKGRHFHPDGTQLQQCAV